MTSVDEVKRALHAAGIQEGTHADRVRQVLDSLDAQHRWSISEGAIQARFGRTFKSLTIHGDVHGTFLFDDETRLDSVEIREVVTAT